jgi:hypothetical protein
VNLSQEEWRILHVNLRAENTLDRSYHRNSGLTDVRLNQQSQINTRLFPGHLWRRLSSVNLEFDMSRTLSGAGATGADATGWLWGFLNRDTRNLPNSQVTTSYFVRKEYRPAPQVYLYGLLEWSDEKQVVGFSRQRSHSRLWTEELDLKLGFRTRLTIQYRQFLEDRGSSRSLSYRQPSIRMEHRWTPDFQNIWDVTYRRSLSDEGEIRDESEEWISRYDLVLRRSDYLAMDRVEIRQSLSGSYSRTAGYDPERSRKLTLTSSIDLYPLHSMILRAEARFNRFWDALTPENDYHDFAIDLKLSLKF